jgi:DNA-binding response OmpR family regulator
MTDAFTADTPALRVLLIEDNPDILANLYGYLEPLGYTLDSARDGFAGLALAADHTHDAIVLDLMLPGLDGLQVCRRLRQELHRDTPVLMLTARDTVDDRILGLRCGADDYLVKPFSLAELDARLHALVRRSRGRVSNAALRVGALAIDPATYEVTREGKRLELTPMAYRILGALARSSPAVVTREALEHELWGDERPSSDALRTHIHALRQALDRPFSRPMLLTIPGAGSRLVDPDAR